MNTGSLRARVTLATLALLLLVLIAVVTAVTLVYRASLDRELRHQLGVAATQFGNAPSDESVKLLTRSLALQGIAATVERGQRPLPVDKQRMSGIRPVKPGSEITTQGSLLVFTDVLPNGTRITLSASSARIGEAVRRLLLIELAVALAALALAALLLSRGTAAALRPLKHVAGTAGRIAAGETSERLRPTRTDTELGGMAAAFDQMVDALAAATAQARQAEETMRRFLADASHELRTPVAALQATAETLLREQPARPQRDAIEATLAGDAARLGRLIDDLLGLARLESAQPALSPVDLAELARAAIEHAGRDADGATISVEPCGPAEVLGSADGLARVVRNLLDNALAAAGPAGQIRITLRRDGDHAEFSVTDDGPGIPAADRERIFERFVRLGPTNAPGNGLGLAIARRIARQHNGDLTCDSVAEGASFTLRLPFAPDWSKL
jgi:signal transduction histidine kinase